MRPLYFVNTSTDGWSGLGNDYVLQGIKSQNYMEVEGLNLLENWEVKIQQVIIINNSNNDIANKSSVHHKLTITELESYDLTCKLPNEYCNELKLKNILVPRSHAQESWHNQVRIMNHRLDYSEVTRIFDHMTAWSQIVSKIRTPTIILEADVCLHHALPIHLPRNSIIGLDTGGQLHIHNKNYRVMPGVWAYSIDQFAARRMFNRVMEQGIREPLELMFRADQQLIVLGSRLASQSKMHKYKDK